MALRWSPANAEVKSRYGQCRWPSLC
jgi:hypothetical protein